MIRFDDILDKVSASYSEKEVNQLKKAYVFAARAHKGQTRRSGEPYLSHPLEVANMLADMGLDSTTLLAGLLHDVLEDTEITPADLRENFGQDVADLVEGVTKMSRVQESSPEVRQAETIRKIILAMINDLRVIFIKLADRIHNLKTLKFLSEDKQKQIAKETLDIYAPIANRLGMGRIKAELEDLSFRYVNPDAYFRIASLVAPQRQKAEEELAGFAKVLGKLLKDNGIAVEIQSRIKRHYSIYDKMKRRDIDFDQVYDFKAMRIVTDTAKNCYAALGIIHQKWPPLPNRFRDFIAMPKPNLYQALHTTIITAGKQTFEIQIRTQDMHILAENGIAAHWRYKDQDSSNLVREDKRLEWLREMVELYKEQKSPREFLKNLKTDLIPEEVYAFTPKGKVITLPLGGSALDFAFKVHSEIGLHAAGAVINGRVAPLKNILKTGDIVEILTSAEKAPRRSWLNIVFTSGARHQIKRWLNQQEKFRSVTLGKKIWERESRRYALPAGLLKKENLLPRLAEVLPFKLQNMESFYTLVGLGRLVVNKKFMARLSPEGEPAEKKQALLRKFVDKVSGRSGSGISVLETAVEVVHFARCCAPIKGEPIVGYLTSGKGVTIHATRCSLVSKEILNGERMVEVSWDSASVGPYKSRVLIKAGDSPGLLGKVATSIAQSDGNITKAEVTTTADNKAQIKLSLLIRDLKHLETIIKKISGFKEIVSVERI
ncbi:MAG TPA: bifunctional (p)ppGpp synthetase/guanosine-3',5'-bis(diphosphate) 3'-pyrophosphohydrolase [Candidatus Desulfaltia sp.]|nr:bifunctional (p)ppGpp synthetase/guanosine-3',5'-bis(diphosphate) 3'-pyrophosphohydrolase [Candidatus Desulfaltia sp.]